MSDFQTGEDKRLEIALTFEDGDLISNYTQIVVTLYHCRKNGQTQKFSRFALVPASANLPAETFHPLTINADTLICNIPAEDTDLLDLKKGEVVPVYACVDLGLEAETGSNMKASPEDEPGKDILIGNMVKSITEGWG